MANEFEIGRITKRFSDKTDKQIHLTMYDYTLHLEHKFFYFFKDKILYISGTTFYEEYDQELSQLDVLRYIEWLNSDMKIRKLTPDEHRLYSKSNFYFRLLQESAVRIEDYLGYHDKQELLEIFKQNVLKKQELTFECCCEEHIIEADTLGLKTIADRKFIPILSLELSNMSDELNTMRIEAKSAVY